MPFFVKLFNTVSTLLDRAVHYLYLRKSYIYCKYYFVKVVAYSFARFSHWLCPFHLSVQIDFDLAWSGRLHAFSILCGGGGRGGETSQMHGPSNMAAYNVRKQPSTKSTGELQNYFNYSWEKFWSSNDTWFESLESAALQICDCDQSKTKHIGVGIGCGNRKQKRLLWPERDMISMSFSMYLLTHPEEIGVGLNNISQSYHYSNIRWCNLPIQSHNHLLFE